MKRIFLLRKAALGDLILTLPVIHALTTIGVVSVATHARFAALLPAGVRPVDDDWLWQPAAQHRRLDARCDYDIGVAFTRAAGEALVAAGVPDVRWVEARPPARVHAVDHYAGVLSGLRFDPVPLVRVPRVPRGDFLVISPGSGGAHKRWPMARWRELAARLGRPVVYVRGPVEAEEEGWPAAAVCPDIPGLLALAASASAWIGPDSGPCHVAAAVYEGQGRDRGACSVVFGPTDPVSWAPRGARTWGWDADISEVARYLSCFLPNLHPT